MVGSWSDPASLSPKGFEQLGNNQAIRGEKLVVGSWSDPASLSPEGLEQPGNNRAIRGERLGSGGFLERPS